jgi:hypothetical protein
LNQLLDFLAGISHERDVALIQRPRDPPPSMDAP